MSDSKKRPELTGVVGYVSRNSKYIREKIGTAGSIDIRFEPGNDKILMRVKTEDITDIIDGTVSGKDQRVHVLLRPSAIVETVIKQFRDVASIEDPTLSRLSAVSSVSVSFV